MNPSVSLSIGTFNARRLWQRDGSVHDGFRVLTHILGVWSVSVLCIQEVQAGGFPSLPVDQPYHNDGPVGTRGREAAFLVSSGVSGAPVPSVEDTTPVRRRVFDRSWCTCSFYAPHAGLLPDIQDAFWREFVHRASDRSLGFDNGNRDAMILPFVDLVISSCNLEVCNPREQATHISGSTVHSGNQCCMEAPACCPLLGSDHFLCVAHSIPLTVSPTRCEHRPLPPLWDWKPTLLRAHQDLLQWSSRLDAMPLGPLPRETDRSSTMDDISLIILLRTHAPS